jgi:hypothetical protein
MVKSRKQAVSTAKPDKSQGISETPETSAKTVYLLELGYYHRDPSPVCAATTQALAAAKAKEILGAGARLDRDGLDTRRMYVNDRVSQYVRVSKIEVFGGARPARRRKTCRTS